MKLIIRTFSLQLKHPFTISRGTRDTIPSLIIELNDHEFSGYGEATANPYYNTTTEQFVNELNSKRDLIEIDHEYSPEDFWKYLHPHFKDNNFLLCALDEAYYDLYTKKKKVRLFEYLQLRENPKIKSSFTIGIDTIETMVSKMVETPFPIYKIKLGTNNDLEIVNELRKHTTSIFRIDANCGWTPEQTLKNAIELKKLGVEFIEQPLPKDNWEGAKEVFEKSALPIIADESCQIEEDIQKCFNHFHGVNIKLMKCGGITPALRMIENAKKLHLKTMLGCMTESSVGISAISHLAPLVDFIDIDGALLLKNDVANGTIINNGSVIYSKTHGTGAILY
ncbi:MAG: dipeptide epimerase [Lutibacter sp.]|nr:dipeptide epimerase [Lutibacter sp.]MBP9600825.1 dipeptide epimerase [Lutibacter sp.]